VQLWVKGHAADQILISAAWVLRNITFIAFTASRITVLRFIETCRVYSSVSVIVAASCALRVCEVCTSVKGTLFGGPEAMRTAADVSAPY
jgi:hypothetical protein